MPERLLPETTTLQLELQRNTDAGINCVVCLGEAPEWQYSYRVRVSAARVSAGICEPCRETLAAGLGKLG